MSLIIPKKPQILYAPMLGSLGGGSVRGFGRGVGGGFSPYETGLWAMGDSAGSAGYGMVKYDTENFDRLSTSTDIPCSGSFPSQMADTFVDSAGTIYLVSVDSSVLRVWNSSTLSSVGSVSTGYTSRGMMVYKGYVYWAPNGNINFKKYDLSNPSNPSNVDNLYNGVGSQDWEAMVGVDNKVVFAGATGYVVVVGALNFNRIGTYQINGNTNEITAMCYGADRTFYFGYTNGTVSKAVMNSSGDLSYSNSTSIASGSTIEDLEVDRFGNIHCISRGGTNAYEVFSGSDLTSIAVGTAPADTPASIILNDYMYIADHISLGQHYKYYIPDVLEGTFNPTDAGSKKGPSTNTLLSSYSQSDLHQKNLEQGGLSF
jgi:hypothetical protein